MARLTEACEVFSSALEKASAELEYVANRLEEEFSSKHTGADVNALNILTRINRLKAEIPAVADECTEVLQAKQEFVDAAKHHLVGNTEVLRRLQRKAGTSASEDDDEALRTFQSAVHELEAKLRLPYATENLSRSELNKAMAHSVVN